MTKDDELIEKGAVKRLMVYRLGVVAYEALKVDEAIDRLPCVGNTATKTRGRTTRHPPPG